MNRKLKEARLKKKMKVTEVAEIIGVSQPTMSSWEAGRADPSLENLIKLAKIYDVTTDYLLGHDLLTLSEASVKLIPQSSIPIYHKCPVWIQSIGWALVNASEECFILPDNRTVSFADNLKVYTIPTHYEEFSLPDEYPLKRDEINNFESVWVEPISKDTHLRNELRGWYTVKGEYVENLRGNRFFLDSYDATWLAFATKN